MNEHDIVAHVAQKLKLHYDQVPTHQRPAVTIYPSILAAAVLGYKICQKENADAQAAKSAAAVEQAETDEAVQTGSGVSTPEGQDALDAKAEEESEEAEVE